MKLIIGAVFQVCMGTATSSPEVSLFKRFQKYWGFVDTAKYEPGIAADDMAGLVEDIKQDNRLCHQAARPTTDSPEK